MARNTMRGFSKRIRAIADGVEDNTNKGMRRTVLTVASAVALRTPVDTGRARANWQTHIGGPPPGEVGAYPKGKAGSTGAAAAAQAIAQAEGVAASYKAEHSGKDVYISNNLPYIGRLNEGSSEQAPAGFIEAAIMAGLNAIRKMKVVK